MFSGGVCRYRDTHWHWTVNLPPKPGHLQEEESSAGLLREWSTTAFTPQLASPVLRGGIGQDKGFQWHVLPVGQPFSRNSRATEAAEFDVPCRSLPTELFKSTFIFPIHHPEPQSFACSSQMSSYEALCGPRSCVIPSPHHMWKVWESSKKAAQERKAGRDLQGTLLRCPRIPQKQEELQQLSWARKGTEAVHLTTDGPHFPQSTFESPLKAPALLLWGTHEMWGVLDAFSNSSKLRENRKINSNSKKGILKFGRKKCSANPTRVWVSLHKATYGCIP